MPHDRSSSASPWTSLRHSLFRSLWIANVFSLIGTWMHEVGAGWLMTSLAPSPMMVALVQTASSLPFCILALPAGALADMIERRKLLLITQIWMLLVSGVLGVITLLGMTTPVVLLALTLLLGLGAAVNAPAWQAAIPELVPREELLHAVTLGSVGFNIARAIGPALGGFVVGLGGPGMAFLFNAVSFTGVVVVLKQWKRETLEQALPEERLMGAMRIGVRYVRNSPEVRAVLIHTGLFSLFGCSLWAFLPIVARQYMGLSAMGYGFLLGLFGAGGVIGASLLPLVRNRFATNTLVVQTTVLYALALFALGVIRSLFVLIPAMIVGGIAWLILLSTLITAVQAVIPSWVRGRVLSIHMLIFFGTMAGGSALWGKVAHEIGIPVTLSGCAVCLVVQSLLAYRYTLSTGEHLDLRPSQHWPKPIAIEGPDLEEGPVLLVVEYHIDPERAREFAEAMGQLKKIRLRDGAIRWNLFRNLSEPGSYIESFIAESWADHLRQHERFTVSDREVEERANSFHAGGSRPRVMHFISEGVRKA